MNFNPLAIVRSIGLTVWPIIRYFLFTIAAILGVGVPVLFAVVVFIIVQSQTDPGIHISHIAAERFQVSANDQVALTTTYDVRKGCVGTVSRGYARRNPDHPDQLEEQVISAAPMPIGVMPDDLDDDQPTVTQIHPAASPRQRVVITEWIPNPSQLLHGDDWHFVEFLSQTGCGWLHGLLPINTTMTIGPKIVIK